MSAPFDVFQPQLGRELLNALTALVAAQRRTAWALEQQLDWENIGRPCPACGSDVANHDAKEGEKVVGILCGACGEVFGRAPSMEVVDATVNGGVG